MLMHAYVKVYEMAKLNDRPS